ncbi:MAG: 3-deoxy-8-phosphooctulonate synthase [Candidatus Delongbacteria bacterium]
MTREAVGKDMIRKISDSTDKLFFIAGPCVIETENITFKIAEELSAIAKRTDVNIIFKASYKKANRSSIGTYTGPGIDKGLDILSGIKKEFGFRILTDIHTENEAEKAAQTADILQIPAFLCRQTDLILAAAHTGRVVNIKKGQFASVKEIALAAEKVLFTGNTQVILTERGTTFGYNDLVVDFRNFIDMKGLGFPVVYDVTHSLQKPAADGNISGGRPEYAERMACAAVATGCVDGVFFETHPEPAKALSDAKTMIDLSRAEILIKRTKMIYERICENE